MTASMTSSDVATATQEAAGQTAETAKQQAGQVTSTAASAAGDVAGTAKDQAAQVANEAAQQVKGLLDQTMTQVHEQAGGATQKLGESLSGLVSELRAISEGTGDGSGPAAEVARTLAGKGEAIADALSTKEPGQLVAELRSFASRNPGTFLLGALAAGVVAGRFVRGATSDVADEPGTGATPPEPRAGW